MPFLLRFGRRGYRSPFFPIAASAWSAWCGLGRSSFGALELAFSKIEEEGEAERNSYEQHRDHGQPKGADFKTCAFAADKAEYSHRGNQDVHAEKPADAVCEELTDEQGHVEAVLHNPGKELRVGK